LGVRIPPGAPICIGKHDGILSKSLKWLSGNSNYTFKLVMVFAVWMALLPI